MRSKVTLTLFVAFLLLFMCGPGLGHAPEGAATDSLPSLRISLAERRLWVLSPEGDTLYSAPLAVGSGTVLRGEGREWWFATPTGVSTVAVKQVAPLWVPPEWHYVEVAKRHGWSIATLRPGDDVEVRAGVFLTVRGGTVGLRSGSDFDPLPETEEIVFDRTLFIPPFGTRQRMVPGVLGPYRLLLANGVGLHGTNTPESIGKAVTHGCIRLRDEDITWLFEHVPIGARVVIY